MICIYDSLFTIRFRLRMSRSPFESSQCEGVGERWRYQVDHISRSDQNFIIPSFSDLRVQLKHVEVSALPSGTAMLRDVEPLPLYSWPSEFNCSPLLASLLVGKEKEY